MLWHLTEQHPAERQDTPKRQRAAAYYAPSARTVVRSRFHRLGQADRGLVRRSLRCTTGLSEAQLTRLRVRHQADSELVDRRRGSAQPCQRVSPRADSLLLATADEAPGTLSGPATVRLLSVRPGGLRGRPLRALGEPL